ncbi:MAG: twin-arginine translocation signal domain-containing protein [Acidobacteria bacterium]|nr:twin-arginine translocation signal domain-containing protein [Acidobacteriota bacterium]
MSSSSKPNRRDFLKATSSAAIAAATPVTSVPSAAEEPAKEAFTFSSETLFRTGPQRTFTGDRATQIAMPIGGIGTGSICMNGYGGLQDFSIRSRPETSALPEGFTSNSSEAAFAILRIKTEPGITKLVEGPFPPFKVFDQGLQGQGLRRGGYEGFPRFRNCVFRGEYPFGEAALSDPSLPLGVKVTAWNPFIPLDDKNSGIPCAILEYTLSNSTAHAVEYEFSYHLSHLAPGCQREQSASTNAVIPGKGVYLGNREEPHTEGYGSAALIALGQNAPRIKAMWLRSPGWEFDSLSALWREVSSGSFTENNGSNNVDTAGRNGASILMEGTLRAGESRTHPIVVAWHFPNCYLHEGGKVDAATQIQGPIGCRTVAGGTAPPWHPYYAAQWKDAREVALYVEQNYASLRRRTVQFKDALFNSTLPAYVLDAVSANLGIMKSPTVLREENGNLWGWEGCFPDSGCCPGSCTHVWNYAQAFPNLYPQLERTLRDLELTHSMDDRGHVTFRGAIPDGPVDHGFHAASDGQLGGIMKVFRDWQIGGDSLWLARIYPLAKRSIDYCIRTWDPEHKGALFEPHHNTYDIEFWGPEPMCTSIYIGALAAMAQMAKALGRSEDVDFYGNLAQTAARYMDEHLFNGQYYRQRVQYEGLRDTSFAQLTAHVDESSSEMQKLLKREGPKYQYGSGCLSDGVIGAWMATTYGIDTPLERRNIHAMLQAIFKYNFKTDLSQHANAQRPGYAMGHEPGLLLCSWPLGDKPTLPFVYSDEVWTGIEYQVASHLIGEGFVEEGLTIVEALRSRYDGRTRNPWNEYECGNWYARAMASYALLGALSGFRYSAVEKTLWFAPRLKARPFQCFFSVATGFGTIALHQREISLRMVEGELTVEKLVFTDGAKTHSLDWEVVVRPGTIAAKEV